MPNIPVINIGGTDYNVKDAQARGSLFSNNLVNYIGYGNPKTGSHNGIVYTVNGTKISVVGTKTSGAANSHFQIYYGLLPEGMQTGKSYQIKYDSPSEKVMLAIYCYDGSWNTRIQAWWLYHDAKITIPSGAVNLIIWLMVESSASINEVVEPALLSNYDYIMGANEKALMARSTAPYIKTDSEGSYVDFNDIVVPGLYIFNTSLRKVHAPQNEINVLEVYNYQEDPTSGTFFRQIAYSVTRATSKQAQRYMYQRIRNFDDWTRLPTRFEQDVDHKSLASYNVYDLMYEYLYFKSYDKPQSDHYGIYYTINEDGSINVSGTLNTTATSRYEFYNGPLPSGFVPNSDLFVKMDSLSGKVSLRIYFYDSEWSSSTRVAYFLTADATIHIPSMASNLIIWVGVDSTAGTVVDEIVHPKILTKAVSQQVINNNTYEYVVHKDSYTVQASPQISAVADYYLAPSGTTADRTADIMTMLQTQKCCKFGPGDYYIKTGINMPDGSCLIGSGRSTRLILDSSVTNGFVISLGSFCSVQDMLITGKIDGNLPYSDYAIGTRDGIVELGDYQNFTDPATFSANHNMLCNLWIENFDGSGIRAYRNDGGSSILGDNLNIMYCGVGVNIELFSEFHAFNNVRCRYCVYGCIMNGGNNLFSNCHWDVCIHLLKIDNYNGNLVNDTHSSFTNCTFCHANNNTGIAIEVINVQNGLVFSNCQIFYSKIVLTDAKGVVMTNFNFGNNEQIVLTRCKGINISNCIFGTAPSITLDEVVGLIFDNNMTRQGIPLSA